MCAEKIQRVVMAVVLLVSMYLLTIGSVWGIVLQLFIVVMLLVWAATNFCPGLWVMQKAFGKCSK